MARTISDGWHDITGSIAVYTENGIVKRAIRDGKPACPYKWVSGFWTNACPVRYNTFRKGWNDGRYTIG